jgi:large subunit ribosomal protein L27Ae
MERFHPGFFGKTGMRHFHLVQNHYFNPTINVDKLWSLVPETEQDASLPTGTAVVVDTMKAGYFKVLGKGSIPPKPMIVKAKYFSQTAEEKIKKAGGACILVA